MNQTPWPHLIQANHLSRIWGPALINAGHLSSDGIDHDSMNYISRDSYDRLGNGKVRPGDVLFCLRGSLGKFAIVKDIEEGAIASSLVIMRPNDELDMNFLALYLDSSLCQKMIDQYANGAAQPNLSGASLKKFEIPLPPLSEQRRIVSVLDAAFAGLAAATAHAQKNLQNARELFETHLNQVFREYDEDWQEKSLADVCAITSTLVDPREDKYKFLPHIGAGNIESNTGRVQDVQTAEEEGLISGKFAFDESAVLYSKIRPYLKKAARPGYAGLCSADMYPLNAYANQLDRDYLYYLLMSPRFTNYAIEGSARAGMPKVNRNHLFAYRTKFPPVEEQTRFAKELDKLAEQSAELAKILTRKLAALSELKQSLLHRAFRGELSGPGADGSTRSNTLMETAGA